MANNDEATVAHADRKSARMITKHLIGMSDANRTHATERQVPPRSDTRSVLWLVGLLAGTVVLLALAGDEARSLLRYERMEILDRHEWWRLVTGHLVHGDVRHVALNLAGLAVLGALFPKHYSVIGWSVVGVLSLIIIDVGFVWWEPQLAWYVGLSGILHGALAAGALAWWRYESRGLALALTLVLVSKLVWEQSRGSLPFSGDMPVIVDAHLYGAIGGAIGAALIWIAERSWRREARSL